jgi:hypothetical protein
MEWKGSKTIPTSTSLVRNSSDENKVIEKQEPVLVRIFWHEFV